MSVHIKHQNRPLRFGRAALAAVVLPLFFFASACAAGGQSVDSKKDDASIVITLPADIKSLDKGVEETWNATNVTLNIFDRLVQFDSELNVKPMLATEWSTTDDNTWLLKLRSDVKFHDGSALTASDVVFSLQRAMEPSSVLAYYMSNVESVDEVDGATVRIRTKKPDPILLNRIGAWVDVVPAKAASNDDFGTHPVGSGPYKFENWIQGSEIALSKNDNYWGAEPAFTDVRFKIVPEPQTRTAMLLSGEADVIGSVLPEEKEQIRSTPGVGVLEVPGTRKMLIILDPAVAPLKNAEVRRALNYAVDRQAIIDTVLGGDAEISISLVQKAIPGFADGSDAYSYDPVKAKSLLAEAGYGSGFSVDLYHTNGVYPKDAEVVQAVAAQLGEIGVKVSLKTIEAGKLSEKLSSDEIGGMAYTRFGNAKADPSELYTYAVWSEGVSSFVTDQRLDSLIESSEHEMDPAARARLFQELEKIAVEEVVPWIFLFDLNNVFGLSDRVEWAPSAWEPIDLRTMSQRD